MSDFSRRCVAAICTSAFSAFLVPAIGWSEDSGQGKGRITGVVIDGESQLPVSGALLKLSLLGAYTISDDQGRFILEDLPPDTYTLSARRTGFWPRRISNVVVTQKEATRVSISLYLRLYVLDAIVVTASRMDEPMTEVAEHATVLESEEMEAIAAHDVGEVLYGVPGLAIEKNGGVGSSAFASIRGSHRRHVLALVDGIRLNSLVEGIVDLSWLPLEYVERIEILKGASSAVWGSSLGGVINIITRSPEASKRPEITAAGSLGKWDTRRGALSVQGGTEGEDCSRGAEEQRSRGEPPSSPAPQLPCPSAGVMGYFVSGSYVQTDGFRAKTDGISNHLFGKIHTSIGKASSVGLVIGHNSGEVADGAFPDFRFWGSHQYRMNYGALNVRAQPVSAVDFDVTAKGSSQRFTQFTFPLGSEDPSSVIEAEEGNLGFSMHVVWSVPERFRWISGVDVNWGYLDSEHTKGRRETVEKAVFTSADLNLGRGTYSSGLRFDHTSPFGSQVSPNFGVVYEMPSYRTILRGIVSRDFNSPLLSMKFFENPQRGLLANPDIEAERAWVYQIAIENQPFPFLWSRCSFYRSENRNAIDTFIDTTRGTRMPKNFAHRRRQGGEAELKIALSNGFSASVGGAFNDVRELPSGASFWSLSGGEVIKDRSRVAYDVGLGYRDKQGLRINLTGHYIWWNASERTKAGDRKFIWDAKLSKKVRRLSFGTLEIFAAVHNLFNTSFARIYVYPLPRRWFEGGIEYSF